MGLSLIEGSVLAVSRLRQGFPLASYNSCSTWWPIPIPFQVVVDLRACACICMLGPCSHPCMCGALCVRACCRGDAGQGFMKEVLGRLWIRCVMVKEQMGGW